MSVKIEIKWFIIKDFIGYPKNVVSAEYVRGGKVRGHFYAPARLTKKFPGFSSLEEIVEHKICSCGKDSCDYNTELKRIVLEKLSKLQTPTI